MAEGALFVEIVPTTTGIKRAVEKDLSGGFAGAETAAKSFWSKVAGFGKSAATTLTAAVGVVTGVALKGGFSRLLKIEDATAKLKGLGNSSAAVTEIMDNALKSVKGTSFGLDAAATVAAGAVAAGVKPGQQLQAVLDSIANSAAASGVSMEEMGAVYNKVAATGRAYTEDIQQIADRGIPIWQKLADQLGVPVDQVRKLATQGKISFAEFSAAAAAASGTVAEELGHATSGAFKNVIASLSRIGQGLEKGVFAQLAPVLLKIIDLLAPIEVKANELGQIIGAKLNPVIEKLISGGYNLKGMLSGLGGILGPLTGMFAALGAGGLAGIVAKIPLLDGLAGPLTALSGPIGLLIGAIGGLVAVSPVLQATLGGVFHTILGTVGDLMSQLQPVLAQILPLIAGLAQQLGGVLAQAVQALAPVLVQIISLFGSMLSWALPMLIPVIAQLSSYWGSAAAAIMPLAATLLSALMPALSAVAPLVSLLLQALLPLVPVVLNVASALITALVPIFMQLVGVLMPIIPMVLNLATQLITLLLPVIQMLAPVVMQLVNAFLPLIGAILTPLIALVGQLLPVLLPIVQLFIQLLQPILALIAPLMQLVSAIIPPLTFVLSKLAGLITGVLTVAFQFLIPVIQGVVSMLSSVLTPAIKMITTVLGGIITFLTGVFTGNWRKAWSGIVQIFSGIWNGIRNVARGVLNGVVDVINGLIGGVNSITSKIGIPGIPRIPHLAQGGIVPHTSGGTLAVIGEGREDELVMPITPAIKRAFQDSREPSGAGSFTYINNGPTGFTAEHDLWKAMDRKAAFEW